MSVAIKNVAIVLGLLVGGIVLFALSNMSDNSVLSSSATTSASSVLVGFDLGRLHAPEIISPVLIPKGYVAYRNEAYHFSFFHPQEGSVRTYDEGGGATTITFQDIKHSRGFQIFIVPHLFTDISDERFKKDVPSGVRTYIENASVDGVRAVTFNSRDMLLGATYEVWFIRNGFLYEVTMPVSSKEWFLPILATWKFI